MSSPDAKQTKWRAWVADQGCCVSDEDYRIQIHHVLGRETKVKGVGNIGHWYILPIAWRYHDVASDDQLNVTHYKNAFEVEFGSQCSLFLSLAHKAMSDERFDNKNLPPDDVIHAIERYRR